MFVKGSLEVNETQQQQQHLNNVYHDLGITRNKIVTAQFECYQKIMKDNRDSREGILLFGKKKITIKKAIHYFLIYYDY